MKQAEKYTVKYAFLCATPFQIFNAINFVAHNVEGSKKSSDLYIYHYFSDAKKISGRVNQQNIFRQVYDIFPIDENPNKIIRQGIKWFGLYFPKYLLRKSIANLDSQKEKFPYKYEALICTSLIYYTAILKEVFQPKEIWFSDDGSGSYVENILERMTSKKQKLVYKFTKKGPAGIKPVRLYVNNLDFCRARDISKQFALPHPWDPESKKLLEDVFDYKKDMVYQIKRCVYLGLSPNDAKIKEREKQILCTLKQKVIFRPHPISDPLNFFDHLRETENNMWELLAAYDITDEHVLIGEYSTTQLLPKILFGKEPYLVFLVHLFEDVEDGKTISVIKSGIKEIKKLYTDSRKIICPRTIGELEKVIAKYNAYQ